MRAAFGTSDYTPEVGTAFGRLGVNRFVTEGIHSSLVARLGLFADEDGLAGVLVLDQNRVRRLVCEELRRVLADACGSSPTRFMVCATHAHNAPGLVPWRPDDDSYEFLDHVRQIVRELALETCDRLQPATVQFARCEVPGWAENRRPVYRAPDGREQVGTGGPRTGDNFLRPEGPDESELRAVMSMDADGSPIGGIVSFPCHPVIMYGVPHISSDYPGVLASTLEQKWDCPVLFLTAPAGDQRPCRRLSDDPNPPPAIYCERMGQALAEAAAGAMRNGVPSSADPVGSRSELLRISRRSPRPEQVLTAQAHLAAITRGERPEPLAPRLYGYQWHFRNNSASVDEWLAREVVAMWEVLRRSETRVITEEVEIQVINAGELAIVSFPCELFSRFGRRLREESPLPHLLLVEQANGHHGYVPHPDDFPRGGYECCFAQQSRLAPDAGPRMTDAALGLLGGVAASLRDAS